MLDKEIKNFKKNSNYENNTCAFDSKNMKKSIIHHECHECHEEIMSALVYLTSKSLKASFITLACQRSQLHYYKCNSLLS